MLVRGRWGWLWCVGYGDAVDAAPVVFFYGACGFAVCDLCVVIVTLVRVPARNMPGRCCWLCYLVEGVLVRVPCRYMACCVLLLIVMLFMVVFVAVPL
jgi:hypothetical protein